jgi:uroporphyrinogen decarboxylase
MFDIHPKGPGLSSATLFADCEDLAEIEACAWPNPEYLDVDACVRMLEATGPFYRAGGCWSPFFHIVADFFGMEAYFVKMYTHPEIVHAVTRRVVDFYLGANRRLYSRAGDLIDGFFFGNDFGTQLDLLISPDCFREFVFPYFRELTEQAKAHGYQVILHSCGSIHRVIPDLIGMGVEALHPLQARAANMDAETLRRDFHGKVAFLGGIDTQDLLVNGSPDAVRTDVRRVRELLEPALVVSPSHECLLPNVSAANVRAMAEAALAGD